MRSWVVAAVDRDGSVGTRTGDIVADHGEDVAAALEDSQTRGPSFAVRVSDDGRVREPTKGEYREMSRVIMGHA